MVKQTTSSTYKPRFNKKLFFKALFILIFLASIAFGGFFFKKYHDLKKNPVNAEQAAKDETERIVAEVAKLYDVPKDEQPNVASVKDKEQLKDQPFFNGSVNGDIAVIYTQAKLAILYRPSTKKIIRVSNVTIQATKPNVVLAGTEADRTAAEFKLATLKDELTIVGKVDAKVTHAQTIIVDLSGKNADFVAKLATTLPGSKVSNLPVGEDKPANADILILTGTQ